MDQAEANGKTVDDALSRALNQIGATRADIEAARVEMQVLDEGRKGLFGRGARDAVVRVTRVVPSEPVAAPAKERSSASRSRGSGGGEGRREGGGQRQGGAQARGREEKGDDKEHRSERGRRGRDGSAARGQRPARAGFEQAPSKLTEADFLRPRGTFSEDAPPAEGASAPAPSAGGSGRSRGRRGGGGNGERSRSDEGRAAATTAPRAERGDRDRSRRREREEEPEVEPDINAEEVDFAAQTVDDLLRLLDINGEISIREPLTAGDGRGMVRAVIDIAGDDLGLLIGRRGDTLLSLQYLVNLVVTRQFPGRGGVSIDVEHYRHRRESQIMSLTERMADRVRQTGSSITLEPMSAAERRLVHLALADDPDLVTNSIGEGENRKVVISSR